MQKITKLPKINWIGVLMKQGKVWTCEVARDQKRSNQDGIIYVSRGGTFKQIGELKAGKFEIDESLKGELIVGRPVFWFDQS